MVVWQGDKHRFAPVPGWSRVFYCLCLRLIILFLCSWYIMPLIRLNEGGCDSLASVPAEVRTTPRLRPAAGGTGMAEPQPARGERTRMSPETFTQQWTQIRQQLRGWWNQLTEHDLEQIAGQ
jgi:hypothetical protein